MRSIRNQLVLWLVGGTLVLAITAGIGLYGYMEEVLEHSLDAALAAKAEAIAGAVRIEDDKQPHLQMRDTAASVATRHDGPFYFQIWRADGSTLARFAPPGTGETPLPRIEKNRRRFIDAELADGTTVRITELSFLALADEDEYDPAHKTSSHPNANLLLVVAHDRRSIDGTLAILLTGLSLAAILVAVGILLIVTLGVRRGLRPLADVSALADRIGPDSLDVRFPGNGKLPPELLPIGLKLNDLLDRLAAAFARERRFSAAVAHELRTPLAEMRSACDVALRWPDDAEVLSNALTEARDVAIQMSTMVQTLLTLARQQAGIEPSSHVEAVSLTNAVAKAWTELETVAAARELTVTYDLQETAVVQTDSSLIQPVLHNLLENAVEYTPAGGTISIRTARSASGEWSLHIANTCTGLTALEITRLFEPFWRCDASRTGSAHTGLGLTLVQAYCQAIGIRVDAKLTTPAELELSLRFGKEYFA